jgi:coiled-coil domain-containing protein 12
VTSYNASGISSQAEALHQNKAMSTNNASLEAAATERKARLAKLAALKRKQPEPEPLVEAVTERHELPAENEDITRSFLSGRNYDAETRGPKLGFDQAPIEGQNTLEQQAVEIARTAAEQAKKDEEADQPIDLFKLQPKKPNWDLKRHLDDKMRVLNVRTENAIARLVRQRIENAQREEKAKPRNRNTEDQGEDVGIEGEALVEGIHVREQEAAADQDDDDLI